MRALEIPGALAGLADAIAAVGVRAVVDRRNLNLPGALIELDSVAYTVLGGDVDAVAAVELLAVDVGQPTSTVQLCEMVDALEPLGLLDTATATVSPAGAPIGLRFTTNLERWAR